ncbi:hypothetical protein [Nocardioides panacisoli]|uniref:Uncharacterized protein n=1 Tax=Nocardioides panacisoli TaxID=627624 RepID=A0ABP7I4K7_9ACTN
MRKIILGLTLGLSNLLSAVALPGTASAVDDLRVHASVPDVAIPKGHCPGTVVHGFGNWSAADDPLVTIDITQPDGTDFRQIQLGGTDGSFDEPIQLCYGAEPGIYVVDVTVSLGTTDQTATVETSFRMTRIHQKSSRIPVRTGRIRHDDPWKFGALGRLYVAGRPKADQKVWLVARGDSGWVKVDSGRTEDGRYRGFTYWKFKPNPYRWAIWYGGNERVRSTYSDPFHFPYRQAKAAPERPGLLKSLVTAGR